MWINEKKESRPAEAFSVVCSELRHLNTEGLFLDITLRVEPDRSDEAMSIVHASSIEIAACPSCWRSSDGGVSELEQAELQEKLVRKIESAAWAVGLSGSQEIARMRARPKRMAIVDNARARVAEEIIAQACFTRVGVSATPNFVSVMPSGSPLRYMSSWRGDRGFFSSGPMDLAAEAVAITPDCNPDDVAKYCDSIRKKISDAQE